MQVVHSFWMLANGWAVVAASFACLYLCICVFVYLPLDMCMMRVGREFRMLANGWEAAAVSFVYLCICVFAIGCVHDEGRTWMLANGWSAVVVSFACLYLCICHWICAWWGQDVNLECWQMDGKQLAGICHCLGPASAVHRLIPTTKTHSGESASLISVSSVQYPVCHGLCLVCPARCTWTDQCGVV